MRLTKEANVMINQYCIDCIRDEETEGMNDKQKLLHLWDRFQSEAGWKIERVGTFKAFSYWLSGLPIAIDIPTYCDILRLAEIWCLNVKTERKRDKIILGWWDFMANRYLRLIGKYKV